MHWQHLRQRTFEGPGADRDLAVGPIVSGRRLVRRCDAIATADSGTYVRHHFALDEDIFDADSIVNRGRCDQDRQRVQRLRVGVGVLVRHAGAAGLERGRRAVQLGVLAAPDPRAHALLENEALCDVYRRSSTSSARAPDLHEHNRLVSSLVAHSAAPRGRCAQRRHHQLAWLPASALVCSWT